MFYDSGEVSFRCYQVLYSYFYPVFTWFLLILQQILGIAGITVLRLLDSSWFRTSFHQNFC